MRQDDRGPFVAALEHARTAAYPAGEYVGQESLMRAGEIRALARQARIGPGVAVLDLCCGVAGPGRLITREYGCGYLGVDYSASALRIAEGLAGDLPCRFMCSHIPPIPDGGAEVVLLLETMLAFSDKQSLVADVARVLPPGGRFAFTLEEGRALAAQERATMPDADTVWLVGLPALMAMLSSVDLTVTWLAELTAPHHAMAMALRDAFRADAAQLANQLGSTATSDLITAHERWSEWLGGGRVRKFAIVAEKSRATA